MSKIYEILIKIKEKPGLYLGKKSLVLLDAFLNGYSMSNNDQGVEPSKVFVGFQEFVQQKYKITSTQNWVKIIEFYSFTDENAFDLFFKLFEEHLSLHPENLK